MRLALLAFILALALSQTACNAVSEDAPVADPFDEAEHAARMVEVTQALIDSRNPQQQAAGLLMAENALMWGWDDQAPVLSESEFIDQLHALIDASDSAITRALLAQLCANQGLQAECVRRGLDDAIVALDGAELFARLNLTEPDDQERLRAVILAAESLNERQMDYALILLDAMEAHGEFVPAELSVAPLIHGLMLSPPLASIARLCGDPAPDDPELDQACEHLLRLMSEQASSFIVNMLASAVWAQRREAQGHAGALETHELRRADFYDWAACNGSASDELWQAADARFVREFLERWQRYGEYKAHAFVAEKTGLDCVLEAPPFSSAAAQ